ncbi:hypothetical protein FRC10_012143 [Ceratobasidium sp. 414]|nr:hypothetical protein FRC10_012143 [Ceratobasidium sp. 414]
MTKKRCARSSSSESIFTPTAATFVGLNIKSDGSEPIIRHAPPLTGTPYSRRRKEGRENLRKAERDMERSILHFVSAALNHTVTLPFRISDFVKMRERGEIPVEGGGPLKELGGQITRLKAADGPAVVVDLDGVAAFWYFPGFIGKGLMRNMLESLGRLARVYRPKPDSQIRDRRSNLRTGSMQNDLGGESCGPVTRSKAAAGATLNNDEANREQATEKTENELPSELEAKTGHSTDALFLERYQEADGGIRWRGSDDEASVPEELHATQDATLDDPLDLALLEAFAYYFSPAWYQTGMQYKKPIQMSTHFRDALMEHCSRETIGFLEAKRLYDYQLSYLMGIIHSSLGTSMRKLRESMAAVSSPTHATLENGWTSAFPCFGVGVNRTSPIHRDTKGIRAGMDVIGVLGTFTEGGDLKLKDLDLEAEWVPGCLGAFDGFDFRHEVCEWKGGSRVALISFCRKSTWDGLNVDPTLSRPTLADASNRLQAAKETRSQAAAQCNNQRKEQQVIDRQGRKEIKAKLKAERADVVHAKRQGQRKATEEQGQAKHWVGERKDSQGAKKRRFSASLYEQHDNYDRR